MRSEDERLQKATGNDGETTSKESIRSSNETKSDANRIVDSVITDLKGVHQKQQRDKE